LSELGNIFQNTFLLRPTFNGTPLFFSIFLDLIILEANFDAIVKPTDHFVGTYNVKAYFLSC
jgi:hypothetical protein